MPDITANTLNVAMKLDRRLRRCPSIKLPLSECLESAVTYHCYQREGGGLRSCILNENYLWRYVVHSVGLFINDLNILWWSTVLEKKE